MDVDDVKIITDFLTKNIYPKHFSNNDRRSLRQKAKSFICCTDEKNIVQLYHRGRKNYNQLVICNEAQKYDIILAAHINESTSGSAANGIHNGMNTTRLKISEHYWWRGLVKDIVSFIKQCPGCSHVPTTAHLAQDIVFSEDEDVHVGRLKNSSESELPVNTEVVVTRKSLTYAADMLGSLVVLRDQQLFTDAVVATECGTFQVPVHKVVLIAASSYFKALFNTSSSSYVIVPSVSDSCLETVITYVYSGTITLSNSGVYELLAAAEFLCISSLVDLCNVFIHESKQLKTVSSNLNTNRIEQSSCDGDHFAFNQQDDGDLGEISVEMDKQSVRNETITTATELKLQSNGHDEPAARGPLVIEVVDDSVWTPVESNSSQLSARKREFRQNNMAFSGDAVGGDIKRIRQLKKGQRSSAEKSSPRLPELSMNLRHRTPRCANPSAAVDNGAKAVDRIKRACKPTCQTAPSSVSGQLSQTALIRSTKFNSLLVKHKLTSLSSGTAKYLRQLKTAVNCWKRKLVADTYRDKLLVCKLCRTRSFKLKSYLFAHYMMMHGSNALRFCLTCHKKFTTSTALLIHRLTAHRCRRQSRANSTSSSSVTADLSSVAHNKCGWCCKRFSTRSELVDHRRSVHRKSKMEHNHQTVKRNRRRQVTRDWRCSEKDCGAQFKIKDELREHMSVVHPTVLFSCPECCFKTQVECFLKRHIFRRHRVQLKCHICGKAYHKPFLLRVHMFYKHKVTDPSLKLYHCTSDGCEYSCPSKHGMDSHMLKHSQQDSTCKTCGKTFKRWTSLEKHERKAHQTVRPFICDKCGAACCDESELKLHLSRHADNKPFSCEHCNFSTFQKSSLKSHLFARHRVLMDSETEVLRCTSCTYETDKRYRFEDHVKMHQNIRDLPCAICDKRFVTKKTLRQHVNKVHGGQRRLRLVPQLALPPPSTAVLSCTMCEFISGDASEMSHHVITEHTESVNILTCMTDVLCGGAAGDSSAAAVAMFPSQGDSALTEQTILLPIDPTTTAAANVALPLSANSTTTTLVRHIDASMLASLGQSSIIVEIPMTVGTTTAAADSSCKNFQPFDVGSRL